MDNADSRYAALYKRNWPIISKDAQDRIRRLKVAVAGCGSTGGAVVDGASRMGVERFHLCDNGAYELNNLNRQIVFRGDLDKNKAVTHAERLKNLNIDADVKVWSEGLTPQNVDAFLEGVDFLFDAVDVTTASGMEMKLLLHEKAAARGIPTGSALDLAYVQWLQSYNYQQGDAPLHGRLEEARQAKNPLKALIVGFCGIEDLSYEISDEVIRLIENPNESACQLACVCFLLSAMMTPYLLTLVTEGHLPPLKQIDLMSFFESPPQREERDRKTTKSHQALTELLRRIE